MLLRCPRQSVSNVFHAVRETPTVQRRAGQPAFFAAVCEGSQARLFSCAETADGAVLHGTITELTPDQVYFSGWLIGDENNNATNAKFSRRVLSSLQK